MDARTSPTFADVAAAAERLAGVAHRTPVLTSSRIDAGLGCRVFFKAESLQRVGAFKFRGAYNAISRLDPGQRARGVVAYSSGNHAQAIALAARLLGVPATIVMPTDAPGIKRRATEGYGARVVGYDRYAEDREQIGADLAARDGLALIPPYDHPDIIAGQGTAALELITEVPDLDAVLTPLGGGGLLSGTLLALGERRPRARVYGVEPAAGDDGLRSLRAGRIVHIDPPRTIADGAQTQHLGTLTFPIISERVTDILTASDDELVSAMALLAATMKIVVEPTGVLGFAALAREAASFRGQRVGIVLSGGNVDIARFAGLLGRAAGDGTA
ncbi:threo-3-hydroxy-L-aspartate ammonia-lyase [Propionicicella superfundia]|uniref:threo-3-hydroxy-L-aspartate ammonia-lyase n=1 Tax=Propionicicella superfundia TaxID=348582 RepID=UPI00041C4D3C|nr:threo-3-hydroxy-L-aspartate ammonia-lyase [Propionicicella superfundia]